MREKKIIIIIMKKNWCRTVFGLLPNLYCEKKKNLYCKKGKCIARECSVARGEIVLQDKVCIAIEKEGWLGKGSVSRYNFCIVAVAAGLGWEFVLRYKNCIATEG